jgi:hypothetical protein
MVPNRTIIAANHQSGIIPKFIWNLWKKKCLKNKPIVTNAMLLLLHIISFINFVLVAFSRIVRHPQPNIYSKILFYYNSLDWILDCVNKFRNLKKNCHLKFKIYKALMYLRGWKREWVGGKMSSPFNQIAHQ